jgi:hypothetical protein
VRAVAGVSASRLGASRPRYRLVPGRPCLRRSSSHAAHGPVASPRRCAGQGPGLSVLRPGAPSTSVALVALAALIFHQAAGDDSFLSDAGNWSAIVAAAILVLGLVFGWFRRVSHGLHVASEPVAVGADEELGVFVALGLDLLNTTNIPLSYEVTRFTTQIGEGPATSVLASEGRSYLAPQQRADWHGERQELDPNLDGPIRIEVRYEVEYGRKSRALWWWRRVLRGSYAIDLPLAAKRMTLLAEQLDGPPTDTRVPLTRLRIFGWRL